MDSPRSRGHGDVWHTLLLVGLSGACAGLVAAMGVLRIFYPGYAVQDWAVLAPGFVPFVIASCLGSAVLGPALWWWAIVKPGHLSGRRGVGVGALGSVLVHPVVWYALFVEAYRSGRGTIFAGLLATNPLRDLLSALAGSVLSLLLAGWITAPIGALAGGILALLQSKSGCQERWRAALAG
jgi:hypothetical protein